MIHNKIFAFLLAGVLSLGIVGCGSAGSSDSSTKQASSSVSGDLKTLRLGSPGFDDYPLLENGKLAFVEKDVTKALIKITKKLIRSGSSYITIIYGSDVTDETAQAAFEALRAKISDDIEIVLVNGGQPVYYYLISVE